MKRFVALLLVALVGVAAVACRTQYNTDVLTPATGPGTPYPCADYYETKCGSVCCGYGYRCVALGRCQIASYDPPGLPPLGKPKGPAERIRERQEQNRRDIESFPRLPAPSSP